MTTATEHEWVGPRPPVRHVHCKVCGIIKNIGKPNGPCKGQFKMRPLEQPQPGPDLACAAFIPDPHSKFCDRCGYPRHEHRSSPNQADGGAE